MKSGWPSAAICSELPLSSVSEVASNGWVKSVGGRPLSQRVCSEADKLHSARQRHTEWSSRDHLRSGDIERRVDHGAGQRAVVLALRGRGGLHHQEGGETRRQIDPEVGAPDPAPEPVADAAQKRRFARRDPARDPESEAVA